MHRSLTLFLFLNLSLCAETIDAFGHRWTVPVAADWTVEPGPVLRMLVERPQRTPRRPTQFALAETEPFADVEIEADVRRLKTSLMLVCNWQDDTHFDYAHLSVDSATKEPVHNGIFHVYGGERVRISPATGTGSLPSGEEWYHVLLRTNHKTGEILVTVNGQKNPSLRAVDLSLTSGRVGIGSFFETALFRNVRIRGTKATR